MSLNLKITCKKIFDGGFTGCPAEAPILRFLGSYSCHPYKSFLATQRMTIVQSYQVQTAKPLFTPIPPLSTLPLQLQNQTTV